MKPFISVALAAPLILLSGCVVTPKAGLADRAPTNHASPCGQLRDIKYTADDRFQDPDQAIQLLSGCLSSSEHAEVQALTVRMRALAYEQKGDYAHAIADREESLRLKPARTGWDIINLAANYRDNGQPERAVELLRKMLQDNMGLRGKGTGHGMPSYYHLGRALIDVQQWSKAAEAFSEGMVYQPDYAWAYAYRGLAYDRMDQKELARADLDKARSLMRNSEPDAREENRQALQKPPFPDLLAKYPEQGNRQ